MVKSRTEAANQESQRMEETIDVSLPKLAIIRFGKQGSARVDFEKLQDAGILPSFIMIGTSRYLGDVVAGKGWDSKAKAAIADKLDALYSGTLRTVAAADDALVMMRQACVKRFRGREGYTPADVRKWDRERIKLELGEADYTTLTENVDALLSL